MSKDETETFDGTIGGRELSPDRIRRDLATTDKFVIKSETDRRLTRLLILHPQFEDRLAGSNLAEIEEAVKKELIGEIYRTLGIVPLAGDIQVTAK